MSAKVPRRLLEGVHLLPEPSLMSRVTLALVALVGVLAGALGYSTLNRPQPQTDTVAIQAMIDDALTQFAAKQPAPAPAAEVAQIDADTINPLIESYLLSDPKILQRMSVALDTTLKAESEAQASTAIASMQGLIYNDPGQVVLGNPEGDVTLVEFFDYNCGYCRGSLSDTDTLLKNDKNIRYVLKEFPILGPDSVAASKVSDAFRKLAPEKYAEFSHTILASKDRASEDSVIEVATSLGVSEDALRKEMASSPNADTVKATYQLATDLGVTGTPAYVIGNEAISGAIGLDALTAKVANVRACGKTSC